MGLSNISLFQALADKMRWHQARQGVLAENIANADTPGYHRAGPRAVLVRQPGQVGGDGDDSYDQPDTHFRVERRRGRRVRAD